IRAVRRELGRCELAAVVGAQHAQLAAALRLRSGLSTPDGVRSLSLATEDHYPHEAGEVVDEQQEVALTSWCDLSQGHTSPRARARAAPWLGSSPVGGRSA